VKKNEPRATSSSDYTFAYTGKEPAFELELSFKGGETRTRAEILSALKAAFDAVKNESAKL
jgi:hypothetical protein